MSWRGSRRALAAAILAALLLAGCGRSEKPRQTVVYHEPSAEIFEPVERGVPDPDTRSAPAEEDAETYILNRSSVLFHRPACAWAARINDENRIEWTGDRETLLAVGYKPCSVCKP